MITAFAKRVAENIGLPLAVLESISGISPDLKIFGSEYFERFDETEICRNEQSANCINVCNTRPTSNVLQPLLDIRMRLPNDFSCYTSFKYSHCYSIIPYKSEAQFISDALGHWCATLALVDDEELLRIFSDLRSKFEVHIVGKAGHGFVFSVPKLEDTEIQKLESLIKSIFGLMDDGEFTIIRELKLGYFMVSAE